MLKKSVEVASKRDKFVIPSLSLSTPCRLAVQTGDARCQVEVRILVARSKPLCRD
jgi:hypothetical protein